MSTARITLTARLSTSAVDSRRGVVRLHPEILDALGLRPWDAVTLTGARVSTALAAAAAPGSAPGQALLDDVTLSNIGLTDGAEVVLTPTSVPAAVSVTVAGSALATRSLTPETLRLALAGKVVTTGDAVSLLPQDLAPGRGEQAGTARRRLAGAIGLTWTNELLTITATDPDGPVAPHPTTVVRWRDGDAPATPGATDTAVPGTVAYAATARDVDPVGTTTGSSTVGPTTVGHLARQQMATRVTGAAPSQTESTRPAAVAIADLIGAQDRAARLREWLELALRRPELLRRLGASTRLGVAVHGPEGVGKATMVRSVAADLDARIVELTAPSVAALEPGALAQLVVDAATDARTATADDPVVLLITDVETLLPASAPPPSATVVLDVLRGLPDFGVALVVTSAHPESVDPRLRDPELIDREITLAAPDGRTRAELLRVLLREVPLAGDVDLGAVGERTPGFVAADLTAVRREAAVRAALGGPTDTDELIVRQVDLLGAIDTVRPIAMAATDTVATGGLTLDDVGDMVETKQALTEAVLWPLRYPDSFTRLGVDPPRGVLLYGPPGCGKTFLVRALAGTGALNVFAVKGAELLDKWVGESERAVRDLFRRAADAAPSLVFLDEVDALAPRRGQSSDSGVADRVVAALLTELDGVEPMRDVVVLGATNRPELIDPALLRPGRLERLVYVPPPDVEARTEILRSASRNTPLAGDVDLAALAADLDGYSAADCAALVREAALTAMRTSLEATEVSADDLAAARDTVRPSLDPAQLAALQSYATR